MGGSAGDTEERLRRFRLALSGIATPNATAATTVELQYYNKAELSQNGDGNAV